ncbi:hypothetical protein RhiirB3_454008 [Rhizophagus irregularis]|nr:hypothetical protein RhiirB3_454008 [Rhizophagus irregularis]
MQKAIQNALAQQKTENQTLIKKVTELQSQMTQQAQVSALQTVEPVRQPRGPPFSLQTEEGLKNYYASEYLKEIGVLNKAKLDADYLRNNNSARIDRMEEGLNETRDAVNELRGVSHKLAGNTNAISPSKSSQPKTYDELLPKLLPAMRKMCLSQNLRTVEALEWKVNKPSKFAVKGNSKYISEALGWYTNVAVTLKNMKGNPIITIVGNYACVDNAGRDIDDTSDTALRVIQNREKKRIQDDFDKSKNENKKLSDQMHQFGEKIRQLHSEKNELILQITHKDISLTDAKSRFTIKSEEMMYVSLVQDDLSEMDSIKRKLELKNVELTSENIVTAQKALIEKDSLLQEVNYHLAEQIPKTSSEPEQILKELHNGVIGGISELEQGNEITSLEITSESPY